MNNAFLILLFPVLLVLPASAADAPREPPANKWWLQGVTAARKGATDSALYCMKKSFASGISDDSLYYLWAEIFLYRGVLDTALALNYSIPVHDGSALIKKVTEQRYAIYKTLGWGKEAQALLDSLNIRPPGWWRRFIPECTVYLSGGGYFENNTADKNYPYPRDSDSTETVVNGNGIASVRAGWHIPVGKTQGIRFGGKLRYAGSRFSVASSTAHLNDSADASFGAYLNYSLFSNRLQTGYAFSRKKDFLDTKTYLHQFFMRYAFLTKKWLGSVEAGYNYEAPIKEHFYYLMNYWDREIDKKNSVSFTLFLSGMTAETFTFSEDVVYIYVKDGTAWNTDFSQPLWIGVEFISNHATGIDYAIPQSHWAVNPHIRYERRLSKRFSFGTGCGYNGNWYREKNSWVDFNYPEEEIPQVTGKGIEGNEKYLAYNYNDGNYYWVTNWEMGIGQVTVELDSLPVIYKKRRVDQSLSLNLFFKSDFGKLGDVILDITARRNFSSLMKSAPVDIQRWYGEMMLTWFFRFKPDYGP
jgi:hypothetical protein